jgi:hypothetical protein
LLFTGWDWASASHAVTILDSAAEVVDRRVFAHTEQDLDTMLARLASHGSPADLPVAIERADGLVVDQLLAAGHPVVAIDPGAFHAARPRWGAAGAKTDPGDSYKLADYLRTDGHRLRRLEPPDAVTRELQALVRLRDDHVAAKTAASNQLGALLDAHWPGAKQLFFRLAAKITLAFLAEFPTPQAAAQLDQAELAAFCRRHAYRGAHPPAELLERLRSAPQPPVGLDPTVLSQLVGAQTQLLATLLDSTRRSATGWATIPRSACWPGFPASASSATPNCSPNWARSWTVPAAPSTPPPKPAPPRSPGPRGRPAASTFAWPPTIGHDKPCTSSPTTPATAPHGQPSCMPTPAPAASATPKRCGSSAGPGCGSSGRAGTPTRPTTRPSTAPNNASQPDHLTQKTETTSLQRRLRPPGHRSPPPQAGLLTHRGAIGSRSPDRWVPSDALGQLTDRSTSRHPGRSKLGSDRTATAALGIIAVEVGLGARDGQVVQDRPAASLQRRQ